jgi:hypothetical protein
MTALVITKRIPGAGTTCDTTAQGGTARRNHKETSDLIGRHRAEQRPQYSETDESVLTPAGTTARIRSSP